VLVGGGVPYSRPLCLFVLLSTATVQVRDPFGFQLSCQTIINLTRKILSQNKGFVKKILCLDKGICIRYKRSMKLITTPEVAERLGVTLARVQQLIWEGRLPAQKVGRDYVINEDDLRLVADRKVGRPRKTPKKIEVKQKAKKA
jgi:excisionase family DNA binding protein